VNDAMAADLLRQKYGLTVRRAAVSVKKLDG
jgi:hypothetical protein